MFVSSLGRFELHAEHVFVFFDAAGAGVDFVLVVWMCKGCFVRVSVLRVGVDGRVLFVGFGVDVGFGDSVAVRERGGRRPGWSGTNKSGSVGYFSNVNVLLAIRV